MNKHGAKSEMQEGLCANSPIQIVTCGHYKTHPPPPQAAGLFLARTAWLSGSPSTAGTGSPGIQKWGYSGYRPLARYQLPFPALQCCLAQGSTVDPRGCPLAAGQPGGLQAGATHGSLCRLQVPCWCPPPGRDSPTLPGIISARSPSEAPILLFLAVTSP